LSATVHSIRSDVDFSGFMEGVARRVWGEPNKGLSSRSELRWGSAGSRAVDLEKGTWFDFEDKVGGGVLDLLKREHKLEPGPAMDWLRDEGFDVPAREASAQRGAPAHEQKIVATYDYVDENADTVFQVVRFGPRKDFRQRRPDPSGRDGWNWSVKGVRQVPYRLPELIEAIALERVVFIAEGEKDVNALWKRDIPATCNAGGAGKWPAEFAPFFAGADVVILPDNDEAGRNHRDIVGASLKGVAKSVRVLELPGLPAKGDVSDWFQDCGGSGAALHELVGVMARPWTPGAPASRFGAVRWADIDMVKARNDWLVEDMLFCGDQALMYGASMSGKSFLAVDMGLAVSRGVPFLGHKTRHGAVIYQAGEGGRGLISRLKAYRKFHGLNGQDLPFVLLTSKVDLFARDGDADALVTEVLAWKAALPLPLELVVIDTFSTASPGANENASEDMSRVLDNLQRIQREAGCAVMAVHHMNAAGEKPRGHTSLLANSDSALEVTRDKDRPEERTLRVAKVKDGEDGRKTRFRLQPVTIGAYDDGKEITSCVIAPAQDGDSQAGDTNARKPLTSAQIFFLNALHAALLNRGGIAPPNVKTPEPYTRVVEWADFKAEYERLGDPDRSPEAIRKALERDGNYLHTRGFIDRDKPYIWLSDKGARSR
jgi:hypothetical protein